MLSCSLNIGPISRTIKVDLTTAIKPTLHYLRYGKKVPDNAVAISYVGIPEITEDNILIQHQGGDVTNTDEYLGTISAFSLVNNKTFYTRVADFLLTDIFQEDPDLKRRPLWFYHLLKNFDGENLITASGVNILDKDMNSIPKNRWRQVSETNSKTGIVTVRVYHDLEPRVGEELSDFEVYYITYRDERNYTHLEVLKTHRVFNRIPGLNLPGIREFTVEGSATEGGTFKVDVGSSGITLNLWFKPLQTGQIRCFKPQVVSNNNQWELKFSNGGFLSTVDSQLYLYYLPEFYAQSFFQDDRTNAKRWSFSTSDEEGIILNKRVVRSKLYPMYIGEGVVNSDRYPLTVIVLDEVGALKHGWTNKSTQYWRNLKDGLTYPLLDYSQIPEFSYDSSSGFIRLPVDLKSTDKVFIRHQYKEEYLHYDDLELNPVLNRKIFNKKIVFYLRAFPYATRYGLANMTDDPNVVRGLYHLVVDTDGTILDWPKNTDDTPKDPDLDGIIGLPPPGGVQTLSQFETMFPTKLIVTNVFVGLFKDPSDLTLYDVRLKGGGIKKTQDLDTLVQGYPELLFVNDYAGKPLGLANTVLVELPNSLRAVGGGRLHDDHILSLVKKHLPLGTYPVIQYYGEKPKITTAYAISNTVTLEWMYNGDFDTFRIYKLEAENDSTLIDETAEHDLQFTLTGDRFRIYVAPVLDGEEGLRSSPVLINNV